jgi:cation diffusion facilitator CzcD-associated flavoprotein CzcO
MKPEHRSVEVIVVGAGIGGLAAAKTYLELSPPTNLIILEKVGSRPFLYPTSMI